MTDESSKKSGEIVLATRNDVATKDYGTNCLDCERYKRVGEVCVLEHGKHNLSDYCRDFEPKVVLPDYNELMQSVRQDMALERKKAKDKKEREKKLKLKERAALKELKRRERISRARRKYLQDLKKKKIGHGKSPTHKELVERVAKPDRMMNIGAQKPALPSKVSRKPTPLVQTDQNLIDLNNEDKRQSVKPKAILARGKASKTKRTQWSNPSKSGFDKPAAAPPETSKSQQTTVNKNKVADELPSPLKSPVAQISYGSFPLVPDEVPRSKNTRSRVKTKPRK